MARLLTITLLAGLVISGCGGQDKTTPEPVKAPAKAPLNGSDQAFLRDMIGHHRGAIAMARVAVVKSKDERVRALAEKIVVNQEREVTQMRAWPLPPLPADQAQMDHHHGSDVKPLLKSRSFDRDFLRAMIVHHQDAIPMSQSAIKDGQNREVKLLAGKIIRDQQREIVQMQAWLKEIERAAVDEPVIGATSKGKPSKTDKGAANKPLRVFNLGSLVLNSKNPEALMTTTVAEAGKGNYGVEIVNESGESYDVIVAIKSQGKTKLVEEIIKAGKSRLMSADFNFSGQERRAFTIKAKIKAR